MADYHGRLTPARGDIAALHLKGEVEAERFVEGTRYQVKVPTLPILRTGEDGASQETQALYGETFVVYDVAGAYAWGQADRDGYVGYVLGSGLDPKIEDPTHRLDMLRAYLFARPDLKSPIVGTLSLNAKLALTGRRDGEYLEDHRGRWVWHRAVIPLGHTVGDDPVALAERYVGAPYCWGGRDSVGLDCSGLIQNGWEAAGVPVPRDADMLEDWFGARGRSEILYSRQPDAVNRLEWSDLELARGDLVFWPGHVGVMTDAREVLHANATHMSVTRNDLREQCRAWEAEGRDDLVVSTLLRPVPVADLVATL